MRRHRAELLLGAVVLLWGGAFIAIKALLDDGIAGDDLAVLRFAIAAPCFVVLLVRHPLHGLRRRDLVRLAVCGVLAVVVYHVSLNSGERYTTAGAAAL